MQNAESVAVKREVAEPVTLLKRIGLTTYKVSVRFSETSKETMEDKLLRMIEREVNKGA